MQTFLYIVLGLFTYAMLYNIIFEGWWVGVLQILFGAAVWFFFGPVIGTLILIAILSFPDKQ